MFYLKQQHQLQVDLSMNFNHHTNDFVKFVDSSLSYFNSEHASSFHNCCFGHQFRGLMKRTIGGQFLELQRQLQHQRYDFELFSFMSSNLSVIGWQSTEFESFTVASFGLNYSYRSEALFHESSNTSNFSALIQLQQQLTSSKIYSCSSKQNSQIKPFLCPSKYNHYLVHQHSRYYLHLHKRQLI